LYRLRAGILKALMTAYFFAAQRRGENGTGAVRHARKAGAGKRWREGTDWAKDAGNG